MTFVSPGEEPDLRAIERAIGRRLERVTVPGFDYTAAAERLEVPLADRVATIRARKARERAVAHARAARRPPSPFARVRGSVRQEVRAARAPLTGVVSRGPRVSG
jgi:ATP-dependent RNA helicase RhlE